MATTHFSQSINGSLDTLVTGASMNALTTGSTTSLGSAVNNVPTDGSVISYDLMDGTLHLSSSVTTGSGAPSLTLNVYEQVDGTNYPTVPGIAKQYTFYYPASTSVQTLELPNINIGPYNCEFSLTSNLGVTLPATNTSTLQGQRKTLANW